jgi:hypothetical protein
MPVQQISEHLDILEIPVDNTEDGDVLPMEIEDNTAESLDLTEEEKVQEEPKTEEDLLNPVEETTEEEEDDDEGF